jgi:hypothetical protein
LVAAFNTADRDYGRAGFLRENWSRLVIPSLAVTCQGDPLMSTAASGKQ